MREVLEDLLAKVEGEIELAPLWATELNELRAVQIALGDVVGIVKRQIEIERLGE
jgi:hypothetical protein